MLTYAAGMFDPETRKETIEAMAAAVGLSENVALVIDNAAAAISLLIGDTPPETHAEMDEMQSKYLALIAAQLMDFAIRIATLEAQVAELTGGS